GVETWANADPLYQHLIVTAERKFWRCVESGEQPQLFGVEPPKPRLEAVRIVNRIEAITGWTASRPVWPRGHHFRGEKNSIVAAMPKRGSLRPFALSWPQPTSVMPCLAN